MTVESPEVLRVAPGNAPSQGVERAAGFIQRAAAPDDGRLGCYERPLR